MGERTWLKYTFAKRDFEKVKQILREDGRWLSKDGKDDLSIVTADDDETVSLNFLFIKWPWADDSADTLFSKNKIPYLKMWGNEDGVTPGYAYGKYVENGALSGYHVSEDITAREVSEKDLIDRISKLTQVDAVVVKDVLEGFMEEALNMLLRFEVLKLNYPLKYMRKNYTIINGGIMSTRLKAKTKTHVDKDGNKTTTKTPMGCQNIPYFLSNAELVKEAWKVKLHEILGIGK